MDESIAQITAAVHQLHDDIQQSESRPSAEEICARLLAIESSIVAMETRRGVGVDAAAKPADTRRVTTDTASPQPRVAPSPTRPFRPGEPITATHPLAVDAPGTERPEHVDKDHFVVDEDEAKDDPASVALPHTRKAATPHKKR